MPRAGGSMRRPRSRPRAAVWRRRWAILTPTTSSSDIPAMAVEKSRRLVDGRAGEASRVRHRRQRRAGASFDLELSLHEIEKRAKPPRFLAFAEERRADLERRAFPIGKYTHQPFRLDIVLTHDVRMNAKTDATDYKLACDADVIHRDPTDHVDDLDAKPAAKIPDAFGALMFGYDAIEMFEIVHANGHALSFQERRAGINASRNACEAADAVVRFGKRAQLNRDVVRFDRYIDPAAVCVDHEMDLGITDSERGDRAAEPTGAEVHGHADAEHPPQLGLH